jgi:hypothetical protein
VFVAAHIVHLLAAATVFDAYGTKFVVVASAFMLAATAVLAVTPLHLRRPAGSGISAAAVLLSLYAFVHPPGMEWFLPLFYLNHARRGCVPPGDHHRRTARHGERTRS